LSAPIEAGQVVTVETQNREKGVGAPGEQRKEFRKAFTEYGWARPGVERPAARPHVALIFATVATLLAVLAGVAMQLIKPVKLDKPTAAPVATVAPTWSGVAGWDCAAAADHGFDAEGRLGTWQTLGQGGWPRDGCHGDFEAIPLTSSKRLNAPAVQWWWQPPGAMTQCKVSVYAPEPGAKTYAALTSPVTYSVLDARGGTEFARFTVNQAKSAGSWVTGGTYPIGGGGIAVRVDTTGSPASPRQMLALAQAQVVCTG
jgi:hypothetical protein